MATIADVARIAGVSLSTVSHVLNGTRFVRPETEKAVRDAIAATGYTPNSLARSLARASTNSVGIAISAVSNPYFSDIIRAVESECAALGMTIFLADTHDIPERELQVVQALHQHRVDGIILAPSTTSNERAVSYIRENKIPAVLVDRLVSEEFDQVGVYNADSVERLVDHLVGLGHRRIGMVPGQPGFATTLERIAGYRSAVARHGIDAEDDLIAPSSIDIDSAADSAEGLMRVAHPPTAILAGNNLATIGVMRGLRRCGVAVPRDVALVGFDDFDWADSFEPRLTVVAQPCLDIGRVAANLLLERIKDPDKPPTTTRLQTSLIVRDSCGSHLRRPASPNRDGNA
jgi:LacI family transcriptional regulator